MISYSELFSKLDRTAIIPFFVIGDPDYDTSLELVKAAIDAGADVLELGIAFSDPIADGPTIQKADIRALESGMTVQRAREFIAEVKAYKDIPIGLLMYYNLIYHYGVEKFMADFAQAGVNSVLIADLCIDDSDEIEKAMQKAGMDTVFMVTPNTPQDRLEKILAAATGFIYTVSVMGVTGARDSFSNSVAPLMKRIKSKTAIPACVGFGISKPEHAQDVARAGADGAIVGSRIVSIIENNLGDTDAMVKEVASTVAGFRQALEAVAQKVV